MSSYTGSDSQSGNNSNDDVASISPNDNYVLIRFAVILSILLFIIIICIVIFIYRRKLQRKFQLRTNDFGRITHLKNVDCEEYNSLDYYSNNYSNNYNEIKKEPPAEPEAEPEPNLPIDSDDVATGSAMTKGNRNYTIYAKNNALSTRRDKSTRSDIIPKTSTNNNRSLKSISEIIKTGRKDKLSVTRNNTIGKFGLRSNSKNSSTIISSPVLSPPASIYNNERANSLANNLGRLTSRLTPLVPVAPLSYTTSPVPPVPSVPSISSKKRSKEIVRGSQTTSVSNVNDSNRINNITTDTSATINTTTDTSITITTDISTSIDTTTDTSATTNNDTSSTITNGPPIISSKDFSNPSDSSLSTRIRKTRKLPHIVTDNRAFKVSNTDSIVSESQNDNKNEEEEEEDSDKLTINKYDNEYDDKTDLERSYLRLSRESNLFKKTLYRIT